MRFLWTEGVTPPEKEPLSGNIRADVLVIGGGLAGVLCAAELQARGADVVLAEADELGAGITKGTTAVLSAQHDTLYSDITERYGWNAARQYLRANLLALEDFRAAAKEIDCDFSTRPSLMYSLPGEKQIDLNNEAETLHILGYSAKYTQNTPLPFAVAEAIIYPDMAEFHPLKFLYAKAKDLRCYTHTRVLDLKGTTAITDRGTVEAKSVIVATHFPFIDRRGLYFLKMYQKRSYVVAYRGAADFGCTAVGAGEGLYFRNYRDLLLIGGGDCRTGRKSNAFAAIGAFAARHFPHAAEVCRWANQDCITLDGIPYIGQYSKAFPGVFVATGFGLWGMTTSMAASKILADAVEGKENPNAAVFAPGRSLLHGQLFRNIGVTLADFLILTGKRCPHLGCALRYNKQEHSWDCPCHGSRFETDGTLIDNPADRNARVPRNRQGH